MQTIKYIIGVSHKTCGLFAIWKNTVAHILYALNKGYIPIVDLQHYQNIYFKDKRTYKDNTWEYFFQQPCNIGLNDISPDDVVLISDNTLVPDMQYALYTDVIPKMKDDDRKSSLVVFYKEYLKFTPEILSYLEKESQKYIQGQNETLGILCRGSDYLYKRPQNHPIQPEPKIVLEKARQLLKQYSYKKIWLATEDENIYSLFKKEFGEMLLDNNQFKYGNTGNQYLSEIDCSRKDHFYNLGKEYLLSLYILSKCRYFIGGRTSGTLAVYFLSDFFNKQKYIYCWELGFYGITDVKKREKLLEKFFSIKKQNKNGKKVTIIILLGLKIRIKHKEKNQKR